MKQLWRMLRNKLATGRNHFYYMKESINNRYPCSIVGYNNLGHKPSIQYCVLGKKDNVHRICIEQLIEDKCLLEKFHPKEAVLLGYIAAGNVLIDIAKDEQASTFKRILNQMLGEK